jgi:anti-sigma B factor antagonist
MDLIKERLLSSKVADGVVIIGFNRGGIRDEREILKTLESLSRYVESKNELRIILDLGNVEYMTSAGIGHLVGLLKKARAHGTTLKLCSLQESIAELFDVLRLTSIFEVHRSVTEAVASFKAKGEAKKA